MNCEEQREYSSMYNKVLHEVNNKNMNPNEIIEYLVVKCYYISAHNDVLQGKINAIKQIINPYYENINDDLFPF